MFTCNGKLEHLLRPEDYSSEKFWRDEVDSLFRKSWQFVGSVSDLSKPGNYLARDVAGVPVVFKNFDGQIAAFKNVCPHRHSMIVREGKGTVSKLKCMYHGWEFGNAGDVTHLPDGTSFKGIKAADFCLQPVRFEILGGMLFANLDPDAKEFRETLGELAPELEQYFGNHELIWHWVSEHKANWKVIEENAVESYHVPMAHPKTFKDYKKPELHDHKLASAYTRYADLEPLNKTIVDKVFVALAKYFLPAPNYERFKHTHIFPNNLLYYGELFSTWAAVYPVAPELTRYEIVGFIPRKIKQGLFRNFFLKIIVRPLVKMIFRILLEDMEIWPKLHKGLSNSSFAGVLSCREERIYAFQQYVYSNMPRAWSDRISVKT
jgi:phenylpropionate dioxygenase-like ring-hydroxylating dioxygenase large terminal subunit